MSVHARDLKGARNALWTTRRTSPTGIRTSWPGWRRSTTASYRAYLLKEQLREVFALKGEAGKALLDQWLGWARRARIPVFVELAQRIVKHRQAIDATLEHRLSNALVESTNTKIRLLTRMAFGSRVPRR